METLVPTVKVLDHIHISSVKHPMEVGAKRCFVNYANFHKCETVRTYSTFRRPLSNKVHNISWELTVIIPFETLGISLEKMPSKIKANFRKYCNTPRVEHDLSWTQVQSNEPDFNSLDSLGELLL